MRYMQIILIVFIFITLIEIVLIVSGFGCRHRLLLCSFCTFIFSIINGLDVIEK